MKSLPMFCCSRLPRISFSLFLWLASLGAALAQVDRLGGAVVKRTLPEAKLPGTGPTFSAEPTTQEIYCARVFEEPLVPIGVEPPMTENSALAAALVRQRAVRGDQRGQL